MDQYISRANLPTVIEETAFLEYPNAEANNNEFLSHITWGGYVGEYGGGFIKAKPSDLLVESLQHIGHKPKQILDIGCEAGRHSLLLAEMGHKVVAMDPDPVNLDYVREAARERGISNDNFVPKLGKIENLCGDDQYEVVLAMMVLHHVAHADMKAAVKTIRGATKIDGVIIANAYTNQNPIEEIESRGLKYMFKPKEFGRLIIGSGANVVRNVEGVINRPMKRDFKEDMFLLPTVAEVIIQKSR